MRWLLLLLLVPVFLQEPETVYTPADVMAQIHKDLQRLPPQEREYARYFTFYNFPEAEREELRAIFSGHCHHLSSEPDISKPALVIGTNGSLVRVSILDYAWKAPVFEKLAEEDPHWHVQVINETTEWVNWRGGRWTDGQYYPANSFRYEVKAKQVKAVDYAPWIRETPAQATMLADIELTGVVADNYGVGEEAVRLDAAPQRRLGGDHRGVRIDLER